MKRADLKHWMFGVFQVATFLGKPGSARPRVRPPAHKKAKRKRGKKNNKKRKFNSATIEMDAELGEYFSMETLMAYD